MNKAISQSSQGEKRQKSIICFLLSFIIAIGLTWILKEPGFTDSQVYTLFLVFFAIGLWVTEAIPAFAVSLFIMAFLVFAMGNEYFNSRPEKIDKYVNTFSSSTIWLFLGGFFLSAAINKTRLDEKLLRLTLRMSGTEPKNILIALMLTTTMVSMFMSNTATTAMIVAAIMPLLTSLGKSPISKALLLGVSLAATTGGIATIIGTPPNVMAAGMLETMGIQIGFLNWILYGLPISLTLTFLCCWILIKLFIKDAPSVSLSFLKDDKSENETSTQRTIVLIVMIVTILLWLTSSLHGISVAAVSAIPIVFLTLTGVLKANDIRALPWDILFLIAGGLSLGVALESTGILLHYSHIIKELNAGSFALILILAYISSTLANFMTHIAASAILIPLGMVILPGFEKQLALAIGLSSSMSAFFPVSSPWNAIVYGTGIVEQKDFRVTGLLLGILGPFLVVMWIMFLT